MKRLFLVAVCMLAMVAFAQAQDYPTNDPDGKVYSVEIDDHLFLLGFRMAVFGPGMRYDVLMSVFDDSTGELTVDAELVGELIYKAGKWSTMGGMAQFLVDFKGDMLLLYSQPIVLQEVER